MATYEILAWFVFLISVNFIQTKNFIVKIKNETQIEGSDYQDNPKCRPRGNEYFDDVPGCGGRLSLQCTGGCIEITKVLYSCNERNISLAEQEKIVNRRCQNKARCRISANRRTFGKSECPDKSDNEMFLWIAFRCNGQKVTGSLKKEGRRRCPRKPKTTTTTTAATLKMQMEVGTTRRTTTARVFGPGECPTKSHKGKVCKFPFTHGRKSYTHCISGGPQGLICKIDGRTWAVCSTDTKYMDACEPPITPPPTTTTTKKYVPPKKGDFDGLCLNRFGRDQNNGVIEHGRQSSQGTCWSLCKRIMRNGGIVTGCEWRKSTRQCSQHTLDVSTGNGNRDYVCGVK